MAFASHCGLEISLVLDGEALTAAWFAEEPGAVIQVRSDDLARVREVLSQYGLTEFCSDIGRPFAGEQLVLTSASGRVLDLALPGLQKSWSETSHAVQRMRDNPQCADEELAHGIDWSQPGLRPLLNFDYDATKTSGSRPPAVLSSRPKVAILREQGVNGHVEMAAAFDLAGFSSVDVHMSDLIEGRHQLSEFNGFVACGGFSYGDVLGAGRGWAKSILFAPALRDMFADYFARDDRFALGVCNGCQMLAALREIIPGAEGWPDFVRNRSEQFEARLSLVEVQTSHSLFFRGMEGSRIPVASAHGEGRADFTAAGTGLAEQTVTLRYVDADGNAAQRYPQNPNGSPDGVTGLCNNDGRVTILMPHPERTLRTENFSWAPRDWPMRSPWQKMFENARTWAG